MHIRAKRTDDKPAAGRFVAGVEVSQPSDPLEQEAGRTADRVMNGAPQGAISVTSFQVSATVPDRHTFVSSDPSDAGLPPVITERGSKTYQLGKINP
jgi:hypothetical protein